MKCRELDYAWISLNTGSKNEHHQDKDGFLPSPLIVCTAVAASTSRLRVGTSVILLPLHHPVRLTEDVVSLDIFSEGRSALPAEDYHLQAAQHAQHT